MCRGMSVSARLSPQKWAGIPSAATAMKHSTSATSQRHGGKPVLTEAEESKHSLERNEECISGIAHSGVCIRKHGVPEGK